MKLELIQMAGRDGDVAYNLQRTLDAVAACAPGTDIVIFPESQITGFLDRANIAALARFTDQAHRENAGSAPRHTDRPGSAPARRTCLAGAWA